MAHPHKHTNTTALNSTTDAGLKKRMPDTRLLLLAAIMTTLAFLTACKGKTASSSFPASGTVREMKYAEFLTIEDFSGYTVATVRNPWDTAGILQRYILVPSGTEKPADMPAGTVIETPISDALVYSSVHTSLLEDMGAVDAIGGVCNVAYINSPELRRRLDDGRVADCGNSMAPDMERIIKLTPQAILLSPFENNDRYAKVGELGIPVVECADYMETSALGRAEWIKFYGLLFGFEEKAAEMFDKTESDYLRLKKLAASAPEHPKVLLDQRYGQVWDVPCGNSTTGRLIEDAGGVNPFARHRKNGSLPLAPEKVLADAHDADIWFVRYNQDREKTLSELAADAPVNSRFKAFRNGNVYGCNTRYVNFYEETPFRPDLLLRDFIAAMHPGLLDDNDSLRYYRRMR